MDARMSIQLYQDLERHMNARPTGAEIPAREEPVRFSDLSVIVWPPTPADHSQPQTDIRGMEGTR